MKSVYVKGLFGLPEQKNLNCVTPFSFWFITLEAHDAKKVPSTAHPIVPPSFLTSFSNGFGGSFWLSWRDILTDNDNKG